MGESIRILWLRLTGGALELNHELKRTLEGVKRPDTEVAVLSLEQAPPHLEYHSYEALVLPEVLKKVYWAEQAGYDAVVLGCFYDVGLREAREIGQRLVVTAPAESCLWLACSLGHKFSILVGRRKWIPKMEENVLKYGLRDRLASFKELNLGVLDFHQDEAETARRFLQAAREAVEQDRAEVIILGCTRGFGFYRELQRQVGVPVLDPVIVPFKHAELLVELRRACGWRHSPVGGYEPPPSEELGRWLTEGVELQRQVRHTEGVGHEGKRP